MASLKEAYDQHKPRFRPDYMDYKDANESSFPTKIYVKGKKTAGPDTQYINTNDSDEEGDDVIGDPRFSRNKPLKSSDEDIYGYPGGGNTQDPNIFDKRYDGSDSTNFYRERPRLYNKMSQSYSNPQLFGYPDWWDNFQNPVSNNIYIYIILIIILLVICFIAKK